MDLKEFLTTIHQILEDTEENDWKNLFEYFLNKIEINYPIDNLKREILKIYGGMGSFNDLVLYKNGELCYEENILLDDFRKKLFNYASQR